MDIAKLFAKLMISRPDVRAVQIANGEYRPQHQPFNMTALLDHIEGRQTFGHYQVNADDQVKFFCFDIDLNKNGSLPVTQNGAGQFFGFQDLKTDDPKGAPLREYWGSRKPGAGRNFLKLRMKMMANQLMSAINKELEIPTAATYSGSKGVHVYGFTGKTTAALARQGALITLAALQHSNMGHWELSRGQNFFKYVGHDNPADPSTNGSQFGLEVYPKQDTVEGKEKGLGNLLRLPLGINRHSPKGDKGFFLDMRTALTEFTPRDAVEALTTSNPWQ